MGRRYRIRLVQPSDCGNLVVWNQFAAFITAVVAEAEWLSVIVKIDHIVFIVLLCWILVRLIERGECNFTSPKHMKQPVDVTTAKAISKLLKLSVSITGFLVILQYMGYSISGVLAFGGLGGLAVGLAAQSMLSNFFGGLMIYLDKPFSVGDWIRSPDQEIEGVVEDIGWRATRIRTFDKRPLYVPNSIFTKISVENPSRMLNRRIYETIGVRYDDVAQLPKIVEEVKTMLKNHPAIDTNQALMVNFNAFGASSLDFFIYTLTKTVVWAEYHEVKQDVLFKINDIIASYGAEIAFPTSTIHLAQGDDPEVVSAAQAEGATPPEEPANHPR